MAGIMGKSVGNSFGFLISAIFAWLLNGQFCLPSLAARVTSFAVLINNEIGSFRYLSDSYSLFSGQ